MKTTTVRTIHHAAHFGYGLAGANDIIEVDSIQDRPLPFPAEAREIGATYHIGYIKDGIQHFTYIKSVRAAEGSVCERCSKGGAFHVARASWSRQDT